MRIVFLDIDGVLNCRTTRDRYQGFIGIDPELVENLAELMRRSEKEEETRIVLSSSWRIGEDRNGIDIPDSYNYAVKRLAEQDLEIFDDTPRLKWGVVGRSRRGREIAEWFYNNRDLDITGFVILDDEVFKDFETYGYMDHLVKTSFMSGNGGFRRNYIAEAMEKIRKPIESF